MANAAKRNIRRRDSRTACTHCHAGGSVRSLTCYGSLFPLGGGFITNGFPSAVCFLSIGWYARPISLGEGWNSSSGLLPFFFFMNRSFIGFNSKVFVRSLNHASRYLARGIQIAHFFLSILSHSCWKTNICWHSALALCWWKSRTFDGVLPQQIL